MGKKQKAYQSGIQPREIKGTFCYRALFIWLLNMLNKLKNLSSLKLCQTLMFGRSIYFLSFTRAAAGRLTNGSRWSRTRCSTSQMWPCLQNLSSDLISRSAFGSSYEEGRNIFQLQKEQANLLVQALQCLHSKMEVKLKDLITYTVFKVLTFNKSIHRV